MRTRPSRRAFTVLEVVSSLLVLAMVGLITVRLLDTTFRSISEARQADRRGAAVDRFLERLRADVWSNRTAGIDADGSLKLGAVRWTASSRTNERGEAEQFDLPGKPSFRVEEREVVVDLAGKTVRMAAPVSVAGGLP